MNKQLDLFKLNSNEDTPHGWIWVYFKSNFIRQSYLKFLSNRSQNDVVREICIKLKCGFSTVAKHLIKLKNSKNIICLPLPLITELVKIMDIEDKKDSIVFSFEYFICKNNTTKERIKAVKYLDISLAKIIGAHLADGYLQRESNTYRIKICDGNHDLVEKASEWLNEVFSIKSKIVFDKEDNVWICWFNSKIIGRYFKNILNIESGKKFDIAKEPELIKKSNFGIRKSFASGVLMFDGCVKTSGMISLTLMSKSLIDDIYEILGLDGIELNKRYNPKKKSWLIESKSGRDIGYLEKFINYFDKGTKKYDRLKFFIEKKRYNLVELEKLFPGYHRSKINVKDVYNAIREINSGKVKQIVEKINNKSSKIAKTTIYKYLHLLEKSGLIYKEMEERTTLKGSWREAVYSVS